jgi:multidrug transporter EmrE-like cation transporter
MNITLLMLALFSEVAGTIALKLSQGFSKGLAGLAAVACYGLSLTLLSFSFESFPPGFAVNGVYAVWSGAGIAMIALLELLWKQGEQRSSRVIGPIGTTARMMLGFWLAGSVIRAQFLTRFAPVTWALGLIGFPALMLVWHWWRIRQHPARFEDTSPLSFALSVTLPLALYFTWWYAPTFSFTSDAVLLFVGGSMTLAALRGYAGCELLALSNWLLRRCDQIACAIFTPIDSFEQKALAPE